MARVGGDHNIEVFPVVKSLRDLLARSGVPNRHAQPLEQADYVFWPCPLGQKTPYRAAPAQVGV